MSKPTKCGNPKCGKTIRQPKTGRSRKYCSDRCKEAARSGSRSRERSSPRKELAGVRGAPILGLESPPEVTPRRIPARNVTLLGVELAPAPEPVCHVCHGPGGKGALPVCDDCHAALNA